MSEETIIAAVRKEMQSSFNGKIDAIHTILEKQNEKQEEFNRRVSDHIEKVEPYLEGALGLGVVWKFLVAIGSLAIGWNAVRNGIHF